MTFQELTDRAIKILQDRLDSDWISPDEKIEIALKILAAKEGQLTEIEPIKMLPLLDTVSPPESSSNPLPIPELYALSESWQKWLVENKLRGVSDQSLVDILKTQGIEEAIANQIIFTLPQEVTFNFIQSQWRSLQQYKLIADLYREQELSNQFKITRQSQLSQRNFYQYYYSPHLPVILTDLLGSKPENFQKYLIQKTSAAQSGSFQNYQIFPKIFPTLHQQELTPKEEHLQIQTLQDYFAESEPTVYLDLDLGDWNPEILKAFWRSSPNLGDYLDLENIYSETVYLWLQSTFSAFPLQAKKDNLLVLQLAGISQWHLGSPWQSEFLYGDENWLSYLDIAQPDLRRYPLLEKAQLQTVTLQAGEALFIPSLWWQQCRAKENSMQLICLNFRA